MGRLRGNPASKGLVAGEVEDLKCLWAQMATECGMRMNTTSARRRHPTPARIHALLRHYRALTGDDDYRDAAVLWMGTPMVRLRP